VPALCTALLSDRSNGTDGVGVGGGEAHLALIGLEIYFLRNISV
jgi:hypothetical protein